MKNLFIGLITILTLNSCATVFGGRKYNAEIVVPKHEDAQIYLGNKHLDNGIAYHKFYRVDADNLNFTVVKDGCKPENFSFRGKKLRGVAFGSSIFFSLITRFTVTNSYGRVNTYRFPIQVIIDLINYSSIFKPDKNEYGVEKINYNKYKYHLHYTAEPIKKEKEETQEIAKEKTSNGSELKSQEEKLRDLKRMYDEDIIDEEEYKILKRRVLAIGEHEIIEKNKDISDTTKTVKRAVNKEEGLKEVNKTQDQNDNEVETEDSVKEKSKIEEPKEDSEKELSPEKKEKIEDLNRMLELGIITEKEHIEMKEKLIYNE